MAGSRLFARLNHVVVAIGWSAIVVLVDTVAGGLVDSARERDRASADGPVTAPPAGLIERDPRADAPALADAPWAEDYYRELASLPHEYDPYVITRVADHDGGHLTITGGARRSYQPEDHHDEVVEIWMFGGSTMFGEGQRDAHTIPSGVARRLEEAGRRATVRNYGRQGYTAWQEMLLFEAELARRPAPDIVVFYDGVNELNAQIEDPRGAPSHLDQERVAARLGGVALPLPIQLTAPRASIWDQYGEVSAAGKIGRALGRLIGSPADAAVAGPPAEALEDDIRGSYLRSIELLEVLARDHDVRPVFVWQPSGAPVDHVYRQVGRALPPHVLDLSGVLTDIDETVFIDGSHTNERGAAIVAEELVPILMPLVDDALVGRG